MTTWQEFAIDSARTGAIATAATAATAAACGGLESGQAAAPLNAISHIVWGKRAAQQNAPSWKYTFTGLATHAAAVTSWAAIHEFFAHRAAARGETSTVLLSAIGVSALAYLVDYRIVPDRFTPGFEKRLSQRSLLGVYSVLAGALAVGSLLRSARG